MFTGIIASLGTVTHIDKTGDWRLRIECGFDMNTVPMGASIACSGICLTVVEKGDNWFDVEVSRETLDKTNMRSWEKGRRINFERSLQMGDEVGGHLVFGHVDGLATIEAITKIDDSHKIDIRLPQSIKKYAAAKGSISFDGISLTVNAVADDVVSINIIPHTWNVTSMGTAKVGDQLNVEIDMLARYVARQLEAQAA